MLVADSTLAVRLFQQVTVRSPLYINQPNKFCFKGHILYCQWQKMITIGFTGTMNVCLLSKPIELYRSTKYFAIVFISLQIFTSVIETPDRVRVTNKVYGVDNLSNNSNVYKKKLTRPKLTHYLPTVENMVAHILWWLAMIFISNIFV